MLLFPNLKTGRVTQYPLARNLTDPSTSHTFLDGSVQRHRGSRRKLRAWRLEYSDITESELSRLVLFFDACQGRLKSFGFTDPMSGETFDECRFGDDALVVEQSGPERCSTSFSLMEVRTA